MAGADVTLTVGPDFGEIPARYFIDKVEHSLSILQELDSAISLKRSGTLRWIIGGLSLESPATITLRAIPPSEGRDFGPEVVRAYIDGLNQLETDGAAPPFFTEDALEAAGKLGHVLPSPEGRVKIQALGRTVTVTERVSASVSELKARTYAIQGSIEGTLLLVNLHDRREFRTYDAIYGLGVPCYFPPEQLDNVRAGLGKRVSVSGRIRVNQRGGKLSLQVEAFRILPSEEELPKPSDLRGLVPDMTGGRLSEDYLRELWGDE
jgi:hypothetical protein